MRLAAAALLLAGPWNSATAGESGTAAQPVPQSSAETEPTGADPTETEHAETEHTGTAPSGAERARAEPTETEPGETEMDAGEIAARAVASVLGGQQEGQLDELEAGAYDAVARDLLIRIETIEKEHGRVSRELEAPLFELGKLYVSAGQCQNAIPILRQAILLVQRLDGVMSARQLPMHEPLLKCLVALDMLRDLQRAQEHVLLVHETAYGKDDVRLLPALAHAGAWYEQAGWYESALEIYSRMMRIARKAGGEQGVQMIEPLRSSARTLRLQMQYEPEALRGRAMEAQGQRMLERAAKIARENPDVESRLKVDSLVELGDWYQISGAVRDAQAVYRESWKAAEAAGIAGASILGEPEPLLYRAAVGVALRRAPLEQKKLNHCWIDFEFTVTRTGEVRDLVVDASTAPRDVQLGVSENLKRTRYRPRFVNGEPTDTTGLRIRQGVWVQLN